MCITASTDQTQQVAFDRAHTRYLAWLESATEVARIGVGSTYPNRGNGAAETMLHCWRAFVKEATFWSYGASCLAVDEFLTEYEHSPGCARRTVDNTCIVHRAELDSLYCPTCTGELVMDVDGEVVCCNRLYRLHPVVAVLEVVEVQP